MNPKEYTVSEYESGWYVEKPDPGAPLEDCKFIHVSGPFNCEADAQTICDAYNSDLHVAYKFAAKWGKP
jgi:hypothetical protein